MSDELAELQRWYQAQCDGDWEHDGGIAIGTLDNPGWQVSIYIVGTALAGQSFTVVEEKYDDDTEWLRCWVADGKFEGRGGVAQLTRILRIFLDWASNVQQASSRQRANDR